MPKPVDSRWRGRPIASACLRLFVFAAPIGAAVATSSVLSRVLPRVPGFGALAVRWTIVLGVSTVVLFVVDRLARRLLPLAVLLRLSLAFPKEAPSRVAVARRAANVRDLAERVERARRLGVHDEPTRAAEIILELVAAVEAHDRATRGHSERVRIFSDLIAAQMRLAPGARDRLRWAALLHDVGKLEVPAKMLNKPGPLDDRERAVVNRHPEEGAKFIAPMRSWLGVWARAVEDHHERYDGTGYPKGLSSGDISLGGRIVAVADAYEVMTAWRPYRKPLGAVKARAELVACSGTHFDPTIVRAFLEVSVGRLKWVSGPLAWLAQVPILRGLGEVAAGVASAAGQAASNTVVAGTALLTFAVPHAAPATEVASKKPAATKPAKKPSTKPKTRSGKSPTPVVTQTPNARPTSTPSTTISNMSPSPSPSPTPTQTGDPKPRPRPRPTREPKHPNVDWEQDWDWEHHNGQH
jgi:HD domain-containing protein